jgi:hypothetical protein
MPAFSHFTQGLDTSGPAYDFTIPSWTPPTSGMILLALASYDSDLYPDQPSSVTGNNVTWTFVRSVTMGTTLRLNLYVADASGSSTGSIALHWATHAQNSVRWLIDGMTGVDLSGGVAAAIVQSNGAGGGSGATPKTVVLPNGAGNPANRPYAVAFDYNRAGTDFLPRANWTEIYDDGPGNMESQWRSDAFEQTASAGWDGGSSEYVGIIAAELKVTTAFEGWGIPIF